MKSISAFRFFHWTAFAKPVCDRKIFKQIKKMRARSIVEIGLENGSRAERIVQAAQKFGAGQTVKYTGIDLFDGRSDDQVPLKLIEMHKCLSSFGVKPQLVPGDLANGIRRIANSHTRTDLVIVSAGFAPEALEASWFYLPRMLGASSCLLIQNEAEGEFQRMTRLEIERLAEQHKQTRDSAAA